MAGNFFGSGDKVQQAYDQRIGLDGNAVLVQPGGFLFNPGRAAANETLSAGPTTPATVTPGLIAIGVAVGLAIVLYNSRK